MHGHTTCIIKNLHIYNHFCFLSSEMAEKDRERIPCSFCSKSFAYNSGLCKHMKKEHPEEKELNSNIVCNICLNK